MKNSSVVLIVGLILLITSCIPSLHPIVSKEEAIIDNRIAGTWGMGSGVTVEFESLSIESDDEEVDEEAVKQDLIQTIEKASGKTRSVWKFERMYNYYWTSNDTTEANGTFLESEEDEIDGPITKKIQEPYYYLTVYEFEGKDTITTKLVAMLTEIEGYTYIDFQPIELESLFSESRFSVNYIFGHTFARVEFDDNQFTIQPIDGNYIEKLIKRKRIRLKHEVMESDNIVLTASTDELRAFIAKYKDDEDLYDSKEMLTPYIVQ